MKRLLVIMVILGAACHFGYSQHTGWQEEEEQRLQRMQWWTDARFGMFIHWGIYAEAAR